MIQIASLSYRYPDGTQALDGVSLTIYPDQKVGVVGANGAGKSTLLLHLNGTLGENGRVFVDGVPVEKKNLKTIRQKVGLVFQNPDDQLFSPTVFDDVGFGPRNMGLTEEEVRVRVMDSLEKVGLAGIERKSPYHLSLGQKKLVGIASVLSMGVPVLALDEPTGSLDPKGRSQLIRLLGRVGGTQVIATHDLDFAKHFCDRIILLNHGRKEAEGDPSRILDDLDLLKRHDLA
jgi:cobalt transport protein ATP-binding subunit